MAIGMQPGLEDFQVLQELSQERGNKVYLARSKGEKVVAIKVLTAKPISEDVKSALSKEASLGARLSHEAIVQTRSMVLKDDFVAVVTEFVPGVSLQRLLRFATGRGVRLPDVCAWYILERVLAGLASAHGASDPVLHRSVSPASVIVGWDGTVKLGDFGLVRMRQIVGGAASSAKSERDMPPLMAPEETRGDKPDARGDVYCAALLAVRLATGRTPFARFRKSATELMLAMAEGDVAPLAKTRPDVAGPLRDAIDAALEPDREKRTVTVASLLETVRANAQVAQGKAALAKLIGRWREALEGSVTPWERRASIPDDVPEEAEGLMKPGTLALSIADERPSDGALVTTGGSPDEPWNRPDIDEVVAAEEKALKPTDPNTSLSRVGSIAPDALVMPLPAMRITMPELPTYGGEPVNVSVKPPPPSQQILKGPVAAAMIATMFIVLIGGAIILFRWLLSGPT